MLWLMNSSNPGPESGNRSKVFVKLGTEDSLDDEYGPVHKRSKFQQLQTVASYQVLAKSDTHLKELRKGIDFEISLFRSRKGLIELKRRKNVVEIVYKSVPGVVYELDDDQAKSVSSEVPSQDRIMIVVNQLPVKAKRRPENKGWSFSWDEDSLLLQLKDGLPEDIEVTFVGYLKVDVDVNEQDDVSQISLERFNYILAFLPPDILAKFYHGFCKQHLWPLFHYMLPFSADYGGRFDRSFWKAYVSANKLFL